MTSNDEEKGAEYGGGDFGPMGVEDDIARSMSQATILKDGHAKVFVPLFVEQQRCCSKPIDIPHWRYNSCSNNKFEVFLYSFIFVLMFWLFMSTAEYLK